MRLPDYPIHTVTVRDEAFEESYSQRFINAPARFKGLDSVIPLRQKPADYPPGYEGGNEEHKAEKSVTGPYLDQEELNRCEAGGASQNYDSAKIHTRYLSRAFLFGANC